jgi:hypothetical protein
MKRIVASSVLVLVFAAPALAQWPYNGPPAPNLSGTWFMNGHSNAPCRIMQRAPDQAIFINENGSRAWGTITDDQVFIPDWKDGFGNQGLRGRIVGDRIVWPDGAFWSRGFTGP